MTREATLATSLVIDFLGFLERQGHPLADVCRAASIDPAVLNEPSSRIPASCMERLWRVAEQLTGDPDVGLHSAESYNPGALSIVGYVILSCRTAREALDRLTRYAPLLNEGLRVDLVDAGGTTVCRFGAVDTLDSFLHRAPRQVMETLAAGIVVTLARLATAPLAASEVRFRHVAPASTAEHQRIFGTTVRFAQLDDAVVYESERLDAPLISADPALLEVFEGDARRKLDALADRCGISGRVLALLGARMKGTVPPLADVASELAMSERSIQRSLNEEQTSYRQLVDDVRKSLAMEHLSRPETSATDVAFLLGFSEPGAFTRAFRRWTGVAPTEFRAARG
ncbi:MAG: AraC family transcriptional regulator [Vicinamibacterales bacterium]